MMRPAPSPLRAPDGPAAGSPPEAFFRASLAAADPDIAAAVAQELERQQDGIELHRALLTRATRSRGTSAAR